MGQKNVKATDLPGVEGETIKGAIVLGGTDREMHVIWDPENPEKEALEVELVGKAWDLEGLKRGATLAEVEKANGAPFKMTGFGWDMGGYALFEKGKLAARSWCVLLPRALKVMTSRGTGRYQHPRRTPRRQARGGKGFDFFEMSCEKVRQNKLAKCCCTPPPRR